MLRYFIKVLVPILGFGTLLGTLAACSSDGSFPGTGMTTSSINNSQLAKPAIDPICVSLVSKIDSLRKDGITNRVAKAGQGKSKTVAVYRTSLTRIAELDRTNAQFQQRCSTLKPATAASGGAAPAPPPVAKTVAKKEVQKAASKATTSKAATAKVATSTSTASKTTSAIVSPVKTVAEAAATDAAKKAATETVKKVATDAVVKAATP